MPKYLEEHIGRLREGMIDVSAELGKIMMALFGLIFHGIGVIAEILFIVPLTVGCAIGKLKGKKESKEVVAITEEKG